MKIKRNLTYIAKTTDIQRKWFIVDANDKVLGRLAVKVANVLRGKIKPQFSPHLDIGDGVIVINAEKIKVTGRKLAQKVYQRYSGYPSGLKEVRLDKMLDRKPEVVIFHAVRSMIPDNKLRNLMLKRLKIYKGETHTHSSQNPIKLEV
jgi:large subunit ribosomal protein L13